MNKHELVNATRSELRILFAKHPFSRSFGGITSVTAAKITGSIVGGSVGDRVAILDAAQGHERTCSHEPRASDFEQSSQTRGISPSRLEGMIVSTRGFEVTIAPFHSDRKVSPNARLELLPRRPSDCELRPLGGILNADGQRIGNLSTIVTASQQPIRLNCSSQTPAALERKRISRAIPTGIPVVDSLLPIGFGQRLVVLAPPGTGKSTFISKLTAACRRNDNHPGRPTSDAAQGEPRIDVVVIAMIGERGREVKEFTEQHIPADVRDRCVVVASTSDEPAAFRKAAGEFAVSIAAQYRAQGKHVLLLFDSLTRYCRALRDLALLAGEAPVRRGVPASVFEALPRLTEQMGTGRDGSVTAIFTMLMEDGVDDDPLIQEVISLVDGHIVLSRQLAQRGIYPAVDVLRSLSRLEGALLSPVERGVASEVRSYLGQAERDRDLASLSQQTDPKLQAVLEFETGFYERFVRMKAAALQQSSESDREHNTAILTGMLRSIVGAGDR